MLPNMFVVMGLIVLVVFLGTRMDHRLLTVAEIIIAGALASLSYTQVLRMTKRF
jgi:ABC-2 type transport system permease protein